MEKRGVKRKRQTEEEQLMMIEAAFGRYFAELMVCQVEASKIAERTRLICDEMVEWFNRNGVD